MRYLERAEAEQFFANRLNADGWERATNSDKDKALAMATADIDRLNFLGQKTDPSQELQFPRGGDSEIPKDIKDACCMIANKYLEGIDPELEYENLRLVSQGYSSVRSTYSPNALPKHLIHGIVSAEAWRILLPYLRDGMGITVNRV